jgi:SagB-type dehydrogenase family enzyme
MGGHGLDWANQPSVFKTYPGLDILPLSLPAKQPQDTLYSVVNRHPTYDTIGEMTLERLSEILLLSHALTAKARHGATDFYYRNVASAGALYPFEIYVAVKDVTGMDDGLYHHTLSLGGLTPLRKGNMTAMLSDALHDCEGTGASLVFFLTTIFFRSSWKYRERAYRYHLLDTGHLAENLFLALNALGVPHIFHYDFDDQRVNDFLAIDPRREGCLVVVCSKERKETAAVQEVKKPEKCSNDLALASQVSFREKDFGLIRQIQSSSSKVVKNPCLFPDMQAHLGITQKRNEALSVRHDWSKTINYFETLKRRRSKRNFVPKPLSDGDLGRLLTLICAPCEEGNSHQSAGEASLSVGFLAGHVEGLESGFYLLARKDQEISIVSEGYLLSKMARICLDQGWLANSALHVVFLSNLEIVDQTWGARGYRYAMLTAGRLGQRIYLGATVLGLGCCGIGAFYDREAANLLDINDTSKMLYLVAAGPVKK